MQQIENYISRILLDSENGECVESVLIIENDNSTKYKQLAEKLSSYSCINEMYNKSSIPKSVNLIIFDKGFQELIKNFVVKKPLYIAGKIASNEDYFELWELYRNICQGIYFERESETGEIEILEWQKGDSNIELSIIIPVYNVSKYLGNCIDTLIQWKAPYVEYIFVDDGSTDDSSELIRQGMQLDNRIQLIEKINGGCASARNKGIQFAKGRYIGFVDGDDFIDASMFYELLKRALLGNYDFTYCGFAEYFEENNSAKTVDNDYMGEPYRTGTYRQDKVQLLTINTRVAIWRCLYKKSILMEKGIVFHEDLMRFDDLPFKIEYIFASKSAVCVPKRLYYYRLGRQGQDTSCLDERLYVHFEIFKHLDEYVKKQNDQRMWDLLQIVKLNTHKFTISIIRPDLKKNYTQKVCKELKENIGYWRCVCLVWLYMGWKNVAWLTRLWIVN